MAEEIHFEIGHFRNFDGPVTLTLTSDDLESHINVNDLSISTNTIYGICGYIELIVDGPTYVRIDVRRTVGRTFFSLIV